MSEKTAEKAVTPADEAAFEEEVQQVRPALDTTLPPPSRLAP